MPKPAVTDEELKEREVRSQEWRAFRKDHLFTQVRLAEVLGMSRREVQLIEKGKVSPIQNTLRKFLALKAKYSRDEEM
jgi:DNA-binding XRE family transcriptional regulator